MLDDGLCSTEQLEEVENKVAKEICIFSALKKLMASEKGLTLLRQIAHLLLNQPIRSKRGNFKQNIFFSRKIYKSFLETALSDSSFSKTGNPYSS